MSTYFNNINEVLVMETIAATKAPAAIGPYYQVTLSYNKIIGGM